MGNPFKVLKQNEKILVFREKEREVQQLEKAKKKIEMKYIYGQDHLNLLASNNKRERKGLIREISAIPALSARKKAQGFGNRASSVQPLALTNRNSNH